MTSHLTSKKSDYDTEKDKPISPHKYSEEILGNNNLKKSTINISDFRTRSENKISKNIEIGTEILKQMPFLPKIQKKNRPSISASQFLPQMHHTSKIVSSKFLGMIHQEKTQSPTQSPTKEKPTEHRRKSLSILKQINMLEAMQTSLIVKPNNDEEDSPNSFKKFIARKDSRIREVDEKFEIDDKLGDLVGFEKSSKVGSDTNSNISEEMEEDEPNPDEMNLKLEAIDKSWGYKQGFELGAKEIPQNENDSPLVKSSENIKNTLTPERFLLRFHADESFETFYENLYRMYKRENLILLAASLMLFLLNSPRESTNDMDFGIIAKLFFVIIFSLFYKFFTRLHEKRILRITLIFSYFLMNIIFLSSHIALSKSIENHEVMTLLSFHALFGNISIFLFVDVFAISVFTLGIVSVFKIISLINFIFAIFIMFFNFLFIRQNLLGEISKFNLGIANAQKKSQQRNLVSHLLPNHITQQFINNPHAKSELIEQFKDVTMLFADIKGFTNFSAKNPASVVVNMLRDLFTEFDKLCLQNDVYKLYTIGDCYVALGLIDAQERNAEEEARNVIQFAFDMINSIKSVRKKNPDLEMRIGIHTVRI